MSREPEKVFRHNTDLGQNFLVDLSVLQFIIERAAPGPDQTILEVGAGQGVLTKQLALSGCHRLYAVEIDRRLEGNLTDLEDSFPNLTILWGDAVQLDYALLLEEKPQKVIANIPYHITTPLIWRLLEDLAPLGLCYMLLMVQKEAADRLTAPAGTKMRYPLGVTLDLMGQTRRVRKVPPGAFRPMPRVDSALIEIDIRQRLTLPRDAFWRRLLAGAFGQRRKTLVNNLISSLKLPREKAIERILSLGLDEKVRAEALESEYWLSLAEMLRPLFPSFAAPDGA